jgi:hypothetical protein
MTRTIPITPPAASKRLSKVSSALTDSQKIGVTRLQTMNIEALEAIRDRLRKAQDREGRWLNTPKAA